LFAFALLLWPAAQQPTRDAPQAQPPRGTGVIAGRLVDDGTGQPIRRARVTANWADRTVGRTTTTADDGRFVFTELPAGRYVLQATKAAYVTTAYGATRPGRAGTPIALADGQTIADLAIKMFRGGVVTGRVVDQNGQPTPGVNVRLLQYGYQNFTAERSLVSYPGATTDDTGTYRVYGLSPGDYVVAAIPPLGGWREEDDGAEIRQLAADDLQRVLAGQNAQGRSATVDYAPVFFPGTADVSAASTITITAAEERAGVDLQLRLVPTARIEGKVTGLPGAPPPPLEVTLTNALRPMTGAIGAEAYTTPDSSGAFHFGGVLPGSYTIVVRPEAGDGPPQATADVLWAMAEITIDGHDVTVPLQLQPSLTASARLVFEGAAPPKAGDLATARWVLRRYGSGPGLDGPRGQTDAAGRMVFKGLMPGRHVLVALVSPALNGWSMKSSVIRGKESLDGSVDIQPGGDLTDWVVTYTDHPTEISGTLQNSSGRSTSDYFIVVFSTNKADWIPRSRRIAQTRPGNDGRYAVRNLPAGEYWIAALTDLAFTDLFEPSFIEGLVNGAVKVTIGDGERKTQDLKISGR
jgi:uncharacterized protein (DUF2141 family)